MAKKKEVIEEPIEEVAAEAVVEPTVEPTVEPIDWFANGYPSRDFVNPLPDAMKPKEAPVVEEAPAEDGGQEQA